MTLIVAIGCSDGVVIAADSASSDEASGAKQSTAAKIRQVRDFPIAFGGSGDVGLLQKIYDEIGLMAKPQDVKNYRADIKRRVSPIQKEAISLHVGHPQYGGNHRTPIAGMLIVGLIKNKPWILEIDPNCTDTIYDDNLGNFHAIGSGAIWAHAYFRPHLYSPRNCALAQVFACRILEDSINIAMMGLAHPIHIHTIKSDGGYQIASSEDLRKLADTCEAWRQLEREAVGRLLTSPSSTDEITEIPIPQPPTADSTPSPLAPASP